MKYVTYGVRELQANLGKALRAAQRGERVVITSRRRPVAVLAPVDVAIPEESDAVRKLRRLASEGRLRLGRLGAIAPFKAARLGGLSQRVRADRR